MTEAPPVQSLENNHLDLYVSYILTLLRTHQEEFFKLFSSHTSREIERIRSLLAQNLSYRVLINIYQTLQRTNVQEEARLLFEFTQTIIQLTYHLQIKELGKNARIRKELLDLLRPTGT